MKKIRLLFVLLCTLTLIAFVVGCDNEGSFPNGCGQPDDPTDPPVVDPPVVDPPVVEPVLLDRTHMGWQDPNCSACHPQDEHNAGLDPFECVDCHGDNGARIAHNQNRNCQGCHRNAPGHPSASFPAESCAACHS